MYQNQLDEIDRRLLIIHEELGTPENDTEYLKLVTDRKAVEKRLGFATNQLLAKEDKEKRRNEGGRKGSLGKRRNAAGRWGREAKATDGKFARNVQIESDGEN